MIRHCFFLLLFFSAALHTSGQKSAEDYVLEIERGGKDSLALQNYMYIVENHPTSKFHSSAQYYIGNYYEKKGEDRLAINAYKETVFDLYSGPLTKATEINEYSPKARAIDRLIDLYEKVGNYDSALYFLYLCDTGISIFKSCEVQPEFFWQYRVVRYADLYLKANRIREAETILLSRYGFAWSNYVGEFEGVVAGKLKEVFAKYENRDTLKSQIETAVNNYFFDTSYHERDTLVYCCFNFWGVKIKMFYLSLPGPYKYDYGPDPLTPGSSEREKIIANLRKSELYSAIREL
jgi:hypothetical protein